MNVEQIVADLKAEITEAQAALRYFERKLVSGRVAIGPMAAIPQSISFKPGTADLPTDDDRSIPQRIIAELEANPDRVYSNADLASSLNIPLASIRSAVGRLVDKKIAKASRGRFQALRKAHIDERSAA